MLKLKLDLVISQRNFPEISTSVRIFDRNSLRSSARIIRGGMLGRYSKSKYMVRGQVFDELSQTWDPVPTLALFSFDRDSRQWVINPLVEAILTHYSIN